MPWTLPKPSRVLGEMAAVPGRSDERRARGCPPPEGPESQPQPPGTSTAVTATPGHAPATPPAAGVVLQGPPPPISTHGPACLPAVWCRPHSRSLAPSSPA